METTINSPNPGDSVILQDPPQSDGQAELNTTEVPVGNGKAPKRILHFSDGTLEEYSTDEDEADSKKPENSVDVKKLSWPQYVLYATMTVGTTTLKVCDYLGENLANFFGITTPKYQYEMDEYQRTLKEQEEEKKKQDIEMQGWSENSTGPPLSVIRLEPSQGGEAAENTTEPLGPARY